MHGEEPFVVGFQTFQAEIDYLHQVILDLQAAENQTAGICLAVRSNTLVDKYCSALKLKDIALKKIHRKQ